ncbi:G5 and 3D domain-containing protein [Bacillus sp. REN3]|uniref:G5 and 3D domain-containing protein n=1 Tax=Bacillus sp. REN3 TaxID=2802440 RepID=UPI001AEEC0C1|nr:G5 and 3D domain-containing protein [Bacillus sp. REN3]
MKNLFSKTLSKKKLVIFSASFLVFAAVLGFFMYEGTKKTVALTLDGKEKVIKTHADTVQDLFDDLEISLRSEDYLSLEADTKVKNNLSIVWKPAKQVELIDGQEKETYWTSADTVGNFLKDQNIVLSEHDKLNLNPDDKLSKNMEIAIERAFPLKLVVGGKEQEVWSTSTTVADFLSQQGIKLNKLDRVEPELNKTVTKNGKVNVVRVEKVTDVVEEPIRYAVITKNDSNLLKGKQKVVNEGQEGLLSKRYEVIMENGKEVSRKLVNEKTVKEKQDKVVAMGTKVLVAQVSRGSSKPAGKEFYVTSTAYTASCNGCSGYTATGINLRTNPNAKVIAVDPSVIPLGTKVYVDGYGYAVAADTGSAVKGAKIDVFFGSSSDAYRWGRKRVKIRVLN